MDRQHRLERDRRRAVEGRPQGVRGDQSRCGIDVGEDHLGADEAGDFTAEYITADTPTAATRTPLLPWELASQLEAGRDICRSLADRDSLIAHLDIEYVNFDFPAEAYLDPARAFALQEPLEAAVKRVLVCSGKVYYDLINGRKERKDNTVAIIRAEQLYPFAHKTFEAELRKYPKATEVVWVQDEPQNQGSWFNVQHHLYQNMSSGQKLGYAGRVASASPAVGYLAKHLEQQKALVEQAFGKFKSFMLTK